MHQLPNLQPEKILIVFFPEFFSFQDTNTNPKNTKRIPGRILFVFFPGLTVHILGLASLWRRYVVNRIGNSESCD